MLTKALFYNGSNEAGTPSPKIKSISSAEQDFNIKAVDSNKLKIQFEDYYQKYNGYIDQVAMFNNRYDNQDYDGDGLFDRIYRSVISLGSIRKSTHGYTSSFCKYRIDFGNGDTLEIGDFDDVFTGIQIFGYDLTGDGVNEIIFCGRHEASTFSPSGSEIAVYEKLGNEYRMMFLPRSHDNYNITDEFDIGYNFYKLRMKNNIVTIYCPETYFKETMVITDLTGIKNFMQTSYNEPIGSPAWKISVKEYKGVSSLILYNHIGSKYCDKDVATYLIWREVEFKPVKMKLVSTVE